MGLSVDWLGSVVSVTFDRKGLQMGFDRSVPSHLKRLKIFPRMAYEFDYAGKRLMLKNTPWTEMIANIPLREISFKKAIDVAQHQLKETKLPTTALKAMR